MLFFFLHLTLQETNLDILPPFLEENRTVKTWSLYGSAITIEEAIILVPKIKRAKGALWSDVTLPLTNWSVAFDLSVIEPDEDFTFGIFYIQEPSSDTSFHGGPSRFVGLSVLGKFWRHDQEYIYFDLFI